MTPLKVPGRIAADHPSLAGHFPGRPIVPGVVLLDAVASAAREHLGIAAELSAVPDAKFHQPLRPGEEFVSELSSADRATVAFVVMRGNVRIASGTMRFADQGGTR